MPLLNKCCFCCQLQTGGVILGWLGLLSASFSILISLIAFGFLPEIGEAVTEQRIPTSEELPSSLGTFIIIMLIIVVLVNTIALIASICLLTGSMKRQRFLLLPWLVSEMASIIIFIIFFFFDFVCLFIETNESFGEKFIVVMFSALFIGFDIYLWLCVYSLFQSIREEEQVGATGNEMVNHINDVNDGLPAYKNLV